MTNLIVCPHCGQAIDLSDPRLQQLTPSSFAVWHRVERLFARGDKLGSSDVGRLSNMRPSAAKKHLERLRQVGLVRSVPKREGGQYRVYEIAR